MSVSSRLLSPRQNNLALEQYRSVRTNLDFLRATRQLKTIAVTSGLPDAGKSLTTANLGIAFAMTEVKTLIVDADLRRPSQHKLFNLDNREGLTSLLMRGQSPDQFLDVGPWPNLRILTTGPLPPYPTEILANGRIEAVLSQLGELFDVILIDTPPVLSFAETAIVAHAADGVLYVVRAAKSSRRADKKALEHLKQAEVDVVGAVLNDAQVQQSASYYYYSADRA